MSLEMSLRKGNCHGYKIKGKGLSKMEDGKRSRAGRQTIVMYAIKEQRL
jgi:hypothetical protein